MKVEQISSTATSWHNYVVHALQAALDHGHVDADNLLSILKARAGNEGYHSLFDMEARENYGSYKGRARPAMGWFALDFDADDPDLARKDVLNLIHMLGLEEDYARVFFSGSKGFHLYIREEWFGVPHDENCSVQYRKLVMALKNKYDLKTLDAGIIQDNRKFRIPNSKHQRTGLHKIQLTFDQLQTWTLDEIKRFAASPRNFNLDTFTVPATPKNLGAVTEVEVVGSGVFGVENVIADDTKKYGTFKGKVCISRMWTAPLPVGERHVSALALIADCFETGITQKECTDKLYEWATRHRILDRWETDLVRAIDEHYSGRRGYSFGCYNPAKMAHCSGTCGLYPRLKKELRANVADIPPSVQKLLDENDRPTHKALAIELVRGFQGNLVKQDRDLFIYKETHWVEAEQNEIDSIKKELLKRLGEKTKTDDLERAFKMFLLHTPAVPHNVSMFQPNPYAANFKNGSLWIERQQDSYSLAFKNHSRDDFLTTCIDADYPKTRGALNDRFGALVAHLLKGDPEHDEKLMSLKQVAGAMLMPAFPQIFFLLGESGSGKSTFALTFYHALGGSKYSSTVQPCDMKGFELEGMINKTVNLHTDIDENRPIPDALLKETADRRPKQVNRKGKKVIQAFLPAVHVYCANTLPPTQVKNQNVYDRRTTIIKLDNVVTSNIVQQYEELIVKESKAALIEFALEGLEALVQAGGVYSKPDSSKQTTKAWQEKASDTLTDFLDSVSHGETSLKIDADMQSSRATVFSAYETWCSAQGYKDPPIKASAFYRGLLDRGFGTKKVDGTRMLIGIGSETKETVKNQPQF